MISKDSKIFFFNCCKVSCVFVEKRMKLSFLVWSFAISFLFPSSVNRSDLLKIMILFPGAFWRNGSISWRSSRAAIIMRSVSALFTMPRSQYSELMEGRSMSWILVPS